MSTMSKVDIRDIQDTVAEVLTQTIEALPHGASKKELRDAVEKALTSHPEIGRYVTIQDDTSEAGFRVKIEVNIAQPPKTNLNLN